MERKLGCILEAEQRLACGNVKSDRDAINDKMVPWRDGDQPKIVSFESAKSYLESEAEKYDVLRKQGLLPTGVEMAKSLGLDLYKLRDNFQQRNDCAAFAATMCCAIRNVYQRYMGAELTTERLNPSGVYVTSAGIDTLNSIAPDNGRTIASVNSATNEYGNWPTSLIGEYDGGRTYTQAMRDNADNAKKYQAGWIRFDDSDSMSATELTDALILCCRALCPVLVGNLIAVSSSNVTTLANGCSVGNVNGSGWGGGHATCQYDYMEYDNIKYCKHYGSWGDQFSSKDGSATPDIWLSESSFKRFFSGRWNDFAACYVVESVTAENTNLN